MSADADHHLARMMLDLFVSVGASRFDLSIIGRDGEKIAYRGSMRHRELETALPSILAEATPRQRNVIVRPHGPGVTLIQLDDLAADTLARVTPAVLLILKTSGNGRQAWVALKHAGGARDKDFARRLRKGTGADATASGATRIAGSLNFKDKYAPDFPRVMIERAQPRRTTTVAELEALGLVAAAEPLPPVRRYVAHGRGDRRPRVWPDYGRCIDGAPANRDKSGPDVSRADFVWCMTALDWGWSPEATAARLMEESRKAQENGERYATVTVASAAEAVARRRTPPRSTRLDPK